MPMMREPLTPMYSSRHMMKPPEMPSHMVADRICTGQGRGVERGRGTQQQWAWDELA